MNISAYVRVFAVTATVALAAVCQAEEKFELGVSGGYGYSPDGKVSNAQGSVGAGVRPGVAFSVFGGNQVRPWLSGEARYIYRQSDLHLSGNGAEARFGGESHS